MDLSLAECIIVGLAVGLGTVALTFLVVTIVEGK